MFNPFKGSRKLRKIFLAVAMGTSAVISDGCHRPIETSPTPRIGALTEGEKTEVASVFGNRVNVDLIVKERGGCIGKDKAMEVFNGTTIHRCGDEFYSPDYSQEKNLFNFGIFMHEMTHIYQFQNGDLGNILLHFNVYGYKLNGKRPFSDYGMEQQAAIIEDYTRLFLYPGQGSTRYLKDTPQNELFLQRIVERQFPEARTARLKVQAQKING